MHEDVYSLWAEMKLPPRARLAPRSGGLRRCRRIPKQKRSGRYEGEKSNNQMKTTLRWFIRET